MNNIDTLRQAATTFYTGPTVRAQARRAEGERGKGAYRVRGLGDLLGRHGDPAARRGRWHTPQCAFNRWRCTSLPGWSFDRSGNEAERMEGNGSARKTLIDVDRPPTMELGSRLEMLLVEDSQAGHAMRWMTGRGRREEEEGREGGRRRRRRGTRGKGVRHILGETVALIMPTWNQSSGTGKVEFSRAHRRLDHGSNTPDAV